MNTFLGAVGSNDIEIIWVKYFGDTDDKDSQVYGEKWNTKVRYRKYGKSYLAIIYIDYFHRRVYVEKQPKGYKALKGLDLAVKKYEKISSR